MRGTSFWYNGELADSVPSDSRAIFYGDALFETIRIVDGRAPLLEFHLARLLDSAARFGFPTDERPVAWLGEQIAELDSGIMRFSIVPAAAGRGYASRGDTLDFMAWFTPELPSEVETLSLGVTEIAYNPMLAGAKTASAMHYATAAPAEQEVVFMTARGALVETQRFNLIFELADELLTPSLSGGGVKGVMLSALKANRECPSVIERVVTKEELNKITRCWALNSLHGAVPVSSIAEYQFDTSSRDFVELVRTVMSS